MKRTPILIGGVLLGGLITWQASSAIQNVIKPVTQKTATEEEAAALAPPPATKPVAPPPTGRVTPMEQRVATIGLLNKRNGLWRDLTMKPGEAVRIGDVVVRLKACETSPPWEEEPLTGAFTQVIVRGADNKWRKVFSGWLFKESPSLNMVEHPIYDVWTKACQMRHPDTGPGTIIAKGGSEASSGTQRSRAPKSASPAPEAPAAAPATADDNSDI